MSEVVRRPYVFPADESFDDRVARMRRAIDEQADPLTGFRRHMGLFLTREGYDELHIDYACSADVMHATGFVFKGVE